MGLRGGVVATVIGMLVLSGCSSGEDAPETTEDATLATALGYLPADATLVTFGDSTPWLKAHGFADESPKRLLDDRRFLKESPEAAFAESNIWTYSRTMDGWGWSAPDIAWSATSYTATKQDTSAIHYSRFRDSTDMKVVKKSLVAHGYKTKGSALLGPSFASVKDPVDSGLLMGIGRHVRLYPDKHLMVSSNTTSHLELPSESSSLGADPTIRTVVSPITSANYVSITTGSQACLSAKNSSPAQVKQRGALGTVSATAAAVINDTKSTATASYSSADTAKADLPRRKALVNGTSLLNNEPYQSIAHFSVSRKDATIRYAIGADPRVVPQMLNTADAPWAMCGPKSSGTSSPSS